MAKLLNIQDFGAKTLVELLELHPVLIYENVEGSRIYVNRSKGKINIKPRSLQSDELNLVDLAMQKYYGHCFDFFENLDPKIRSLMPSNWWFEFEYFYDHEPAHTHYQRMPKNKLVLTGIIRGKKRDLDLNLLHEWAQLFDVDLLPVLYAGKLSAEQIEKIRYFLETSPEDLEYVFGEENFTQFFYHVLNPRLQNSFLMNPGNFQENLKNLILHVLGKNLALRFAMVNPDYERKEEENTQFAETYSILLINFLEFTQIVEIDKLKIQGTNRAEFYLDLVCQLFDNWMKYAHNSLEKFEFTVPKFFHYEKFQVNQDLIQNEACLRWIRMNRKFEYAFRCILGTLQHPQRKKFGSMSDRSLEFLNQIIEQIDHKIKKEMNILRTDILKKKGLMDFSDYEMVNFDQDAAQDIYPDVLRQPEKAKRIKIPKKGGLPPKKGL